MTSLELSRVMIAGASSGVGKTTITCAILQALKVRGVDVAAFKVGPDYIDPMFHSEVLGIKSRNIDTFLQGDVTINRVIAENAQGKLAVIEGVMGFYDGLGGVSCKASSWQVSELSGTPAILILNCKGKSLSIAAEVNGFLNFKSNNIVGIILNGATDNTYKMYADIIKNNTKAQLLGYLPRLKGVEFESRHLGLVTADEVNDIKNKIKLLGEAAERYIDIDSVIAIAKNAPHLTYEKREIKPIGRCRIGVAKDRAFCFYYQDNLDILEKLGAELIYFSPMKDGALPIGLDGLIFGGGYPELYLNELSDNRSMLEDIRCNSDLPIIAECGGFMYLGKGLNGFEMVGIIDNSSLMTDKLTRFGYITLTAQKDNMLMKKGDIVNAHEFHYSDSANNGDSCIAKKPIGGRSWSAIIADGKLFAGYPHINFQGAFSLAENFIKACISKC